jgi:CO/xanthine dehydrogenase FAD-binding subunit
MILANDYDVVRVGSLPEALAVLAAQETIPLAGGTDLMVYLEAGQLPPCTFLDLSGIDGLDRYELSSTYLRLGALTTYREARVRPEIRHTFPLLALAAREVGSLAIQNRGTWVGNVVNASPAADGIPALMAYDAELELSSTTGTRRAVLSNFYTGYKRMDKRADELVTEIVLPRPNSQWFEYYRKVGTRRFQAISKTLLAGRIALDVAHRVQDVRLVFASVAPYTLRALQTEGILRGQELTPDLIEQAAQAVQDEIRPIDDIRSTEAYRRHVTSNLVRDFLRKSLVSGPKP